MRFIFLLAYSFFVYVSMGSISSFATPGIVSQQIEFQVKQVTPKDSPIISLSDKGLLLSQSLETRRCISCHFGVIRQSTMVPGGIIALAIAGVAVYAISLVGSLISIIGNSVIFQDSEAMVLRDWGITGIVFGGTGIMLGGIYFGLAVSSFVEAQQAGYSSDMTVPVVVLLLAIALGSPSIGLGIRNIIRAKGIRTRKISMNIIPWFAQGKNQSVISGISAVGVF